MTPDAIITELLRLNQVIEGERYRAENGGEFQAASALQWAAKQTRDTIVRITGGNHGLVADRGGGDPCLSRLDGRDGK